jgi:hypothetical protein
MSRKQVYGGWQTECRQENKVGVQDSRLLTAARFPVRCACRQGGEGGDFDAVLSTSAHPRAVGDTPRSAFQTMNKPIPLGSRRERSAPPDTMGGRAESLQGSQGSRTSGAKTLSNPPSLAVEPRRHVSDNQLVAERRVTSTYVIGIVPFKTRGHPNLIKFSLETDFVEGLVSGSA